MNIADTLERKIIDDIASGMNLESLSYDENLLENAIIDSLGLMKMIDFIEKKFSIEIDDEDILPENFETINSMVTLVKKQIG